MYQDSVIISFLEKEYPHVLEDIHVRLKDFKRKEFTEQNVMQAFFDFATCTKQDITEVDWLKNIEFRRDLVAFMLLTFEPERIRGYTDKFVIWGLSTELSKITHVSRRVISRDVKTVCDYFRIYKELKNRWLGIFDKNSCK